jgi:hypothetical protein
VDGLAPTPNRFLRSASLLLSLPRSPFLDNFLFASDQEAISCVGLAPKPTWKTKSTVYFRIQSPSKADAFLDARQYPLLYVSLAKSLIACLSAFESGPLAFAA